MTSDQSQGRAERPLGHTGPDTRGVAAAACEPERMSDFLHVLAHELRNHVAPIKNAVQLMRRGSSGPDLVPMLDMIERQAFGIVRALEVIIDAERTSRGDIALMPRRVDIASAIKAAIERMQSQIESRGQRLHLSIPSVPIWVHADPTRIGQVLDTLLDNATRYNDQGGDIWIEITPAAGEVELRVRDSGRGMNAAFLPHAFDYFAGRGQSEHGVGVGLAVAHSIVELHGGRIDASSGGEGNGSLFVVHLPAANGDENVVEAPVKKEQGEVAGRAAAGDATPVPPSEMTDGTRLAAGGILRMPLRILIADDSAAVRDSLASLLKDMGHQVRAAHDGADAVELAQRWRPDFVLLDIHMPKLNGLMAARALRAQFSSKLMRLVLMSGITLDEETLEGAKAAGFDSCIDKVSALAGLEKLFKSIDV
jgi:CheY-like chemotaxis protein